MNLKYPVILASASPRRKELLKLADIAFTVHPCEKEEVVKSSDPKEVVMDLACQKACAVAEEYESGVIVIGSDTVVALDGRLLGKPHSKEEAKDMLKMLQGREHFVYTGVAVLVKQGGETVRRVFCESAQVTMYPVSEPEIVNYVETGEPMDKAGAYAVQGKSCVFIRSVEGEYNTIVGLPIARLYQELKEMGLEEVHD